MKTSIDSLVGDSRSWALGRMEWNQDFSKRLDALASLPYQLSTQLTRSATNQPERTYTPIQAIPNIVRSIAMQSLGDDTNIDLLMSMLPRNLPGSKSGNTNYIETAPIVSRIKWRVKMAKRFGLSIDVFRDERMDENSKTDDLAILQTFGNARMPQTTEERKIARRLTDLRHGQSDIIEKLDVVGVAARESAEMGKRTNVLVEAFTPPRPGDYVCSEKNLEQILLGKNVRRSERQIRRWETFLRTGGERGTKPPLDYTLQTRLTLASATTWAETFAARERGKLITRTRLDERTATRDAVPRRRT